MSAMVADHRELRRQWLLEKGELEGRCFQLQTLHTQFKGTLVKKEKDFDKLQLQLGKLIKDSQRGQKSMVTVTKPLIKASSQKQGGSLLRDAELLACMESVRLLEV